MNTENSRPSELGAIPEDKVTHLDVRPILKAGGEPFQEIMAAVSKTPPEGALRLRATFQPTPLFRVLGGQGWEHWVEYGSGDDWAIWFYQAGQVRKGPDLAEVYIDHPDLKGRLKIEEKTWYLNVKKMSPPEPMELTLAVLEKLPEDTTLVQINERVPQFLLPLLQDRGFKYEATQNSEQEFRISIERIK